MSQELTVTIEKLSHCFQLPTKATKGSAAYDLYASNEEDMILWPHIIDCIPLGFKTTFPSNVVAKIHLRSSLARSGIVLANQVGIIDSDYPDEWQLLLTCRRDISSVSEETGKKLRTIKRGMRIAQVIFEPIYRPMLVEGKVEQTTDRDGGFGSTGV